ncbi:hypothetical protein N7517_003747 [Penicillium concentricum]|uniref:Zn(2)-C6 fungal-type domain-containing protein n=1 Tax=Penicillium concentricum TaxID=293559 RepID=A0A9W9VA08_9EURO|nr:uncharacterized protein N7517_003747 [Penicillium concentricum]KAJ5371741.1 hypothetical protein N7517_003747 [Penicillium concentricum]
MPTEETCNPRKRQRQENNERPSYPRKRAVQACHTCRQKRIKCDNEKPVCGSCVGLAMPCIYRENDKSTFDPASILILQRLDTLEELVRRSTLSPGSLPATPDPSLAQGTLQNQLSPPAEGRLQALERTESSTLYHINVESILSWPVFQTCNIAQKHDLRALLQQPNEIPEQHYLPVSLEFENGGARQLLQRFIRHVHIYNPVLEIGKVQEYMRDTLFDGLVNLKAFVIGSAHSHQLLIYALGTISGPPDSQSSSPSSSLDIRQSEEFKKAEAYFLAARKRMGVLLGGSGIIEAQCFFLAGVYLMATLRPFQAWSMFVQALVCCEGFNSPIPPSDANHDEKHTLRESIYWTCFKSELELRLELGVGKTSCLDLTYPALFPSPPKDLEIQGETVWYFYLAEIALRRLGNRVLNYVYNCKPFGKSAELETTREFEGQTHGLLNSLPGLLKPDTPSEEAQAKDEEHSALRFILKGHAIDCFEMVYWPFIFDAIHEGLPCDPELVEFTRKGLHICASRIGNNKAGFYYRHHGTWLMLRSCTRSALVLCGAARRGLVTLLPPRWKNGVEQVMQMLRYWSLEANDIASQLEILEDMIKDIPEDC